MTSPAIVKQVAELRSVLERLLKEDDAVLRDAFLGTGAVKLAKEARHTAEQYIYTELVFLAGGCQEIQRRLLTMAPSQTGASAVDFGAVSHQFSNGEAGGNMPRCSFCDKSREQVKHLISHRNSVFICDECVNLCQDILHAPTGG